MREIVFFDVEATAPSPAAGFELLEFGAILVCPRRLVEVASYSTLIRPADPSSISKRFAGETRDAIAAAPPFGAVAGEIFDLLDGRVWVGHNIRRFDCHRIREAFDGAGRRPPEPAGVIDSVAVLARGFGRRAGDLKMATLAAYFNIGKQKHRSLDDARMNLEVLKHCATVMLLESSMPEMFPDKNAGSPTVVTRSRANEPSPSPSPVPVVTASRRSPPLSATSHRIGPYKKANISKVVEAAKAALRSAPGAPAFHMILRHSRPLIR